jgi:predicted transcriptional regulator of viral defense system
MSINSGTPSTTRGFVADFVDTRQQQGLYTFTDADLAAVSNQSKVARRIALMRLGKRGRIIRPLPRHDFFVIVPHEHHSLGAPPSSWYLDPLMRYLRQPSYYIGLLTAAQWHGASHFPVQETQVIVPKQLRPLQVGRERIRFFTKADAAGTPVETRTLENGPIRISTPEATATDLVRYIDAAGGLNVIATVLAELKTKLKPAALEETVAKCSNVATAQRLGFLLERIGNASLTAPLTRWIAKQHPRILPLDSEASVKDASLNDRWRLWINADVEPSI